MTWSMTTRTGLETVRSQSEVVTDMQRTHSRPTVTLKLCDLSFSFLLKDRRKPTKKFLDANVLSEEYFSVHESES